MKKSLLYVKLIIALCIFNCSTAILNAQIIPSYTFSQSTTTSYDTLTSGQLIASGASLDNEVYPVSLPFSFNYDNTIYNSIYVAVNGFISFGATNPGTGYWMLMSSSGGFKVASGFDANLAGKDAATRLSYQTLGTAPNRTFVIEWKNFGYSASTALTTNFQIRLSETTGLITYSYGNVALIGASNISIQVGLRGSGNSVYNNRVSSISSWTATTAGTSSSAAISYQATRNPPSGLKYIYTPPANCVAPGTPSALVLTPALNSVNIAYTAPVPSPGGYVIVRTNGTTVLSSAPQDGVSYTAGDPIGNGTVIYVGALRSYTNTGLPPNTSYTYSVFAYNSSSCYYTPKYSQTTPLTGNTETLGPRTYYWNSTAASADFQTAANWQPARIYTDPQDTLIFNNGVNATLSNVPATLNVNRIQFSGATAINLTSNNTAAIVVRDLLSIDAGSALTLSGSNAISLGYNSSADATINGKFTLAGNCTYDARYSNTIVNGEVYVTGANADFNTSCTNANNCTTAFLFRAGSKYYHQRNGGRIPSASFDPASTTYITGTTSVAPSMTLLNNQNQMMGNLVVNCPLATAPINFTGFVYNFNNVDIIDPGQMYFSFPSAARVNGNLNLFKGVVNGGTGLIVTGNVLVDSATMNNSVDLFVAGDLRVNAGTIRGGFTLNGNTHQNVIINGSIVVNGFSQKVRLNNPAGATLTGIIAITDGDVYVTSGKWDGTGRFAYNGGINTQLTYDGPSTLYTSPVEWPSLNKPNIINISQSGPSPHNRVYLQENHADTGSFTSLYLNSGVLVLGNYNLRITYAYANTLGSYMPFVATNGTGQLIQAGNFSFPLGSISNGDQYSPISLSFTGAGSSREIGARVINAPHPSMPATPDYISRYWTFTDNDTTALPYKVYLSFSAADKNGSGAYPMQVWNGSSWQSLLNNVYNDTTIRVDSPVNGHFRNKAITFFREPSLTSNVYTWNGSVNTDFQVPGNWTPARNNITFTDVLRFNSGGTVPVTNVPGQFITRLQVNNNTTVNVSGTILSNPNNTNSFDFVTDSDPLTNELEIAAGSSLNFTANGRMSLGFLGNGNKALIAGKLDMNVYGQIDFTNCKAYVAPSAILSAGAPSISSGVYMNPFVSGDSTLKIDGTYLHNYVVTTGYIPYASWGTGSSVVINDRTVSNPPAGINQSFYNFSFNTPSIGGSVSWTSTTMDSVRGTLQVLSTGTGTWNLGSTSTAMYINKFRMNAGKMSLLGSFSFGDSVIKAAGTVTCGSTNTNIYFSGTNGRQYFASNDSAFFINGNYIITNPAGITVAATAPFTTGAVFTVSKGMTIATASIPPVATTLDVAYTAGTSLSYQGPARQSDAIVFPAINGPKNVTINLDTPSGVLLVPFTRNIPGTLSMLKGDIDFGANSLTLGTSASNPGDYSGTGKIRLTTGTLTRWLSTVSDETTVGNARALFPIAYGNSDRSVSLFFNNNTAITTGGSLTVGHTNAGTSTNGLAIPDGTITIAKRFNSGWTFTPGNGLVVGGTIGMALMSGDNYINPAQLRIMWPQSVTGANYTTSLGNFVVARNNLSLSNLADSTFYIGTTNANTSNVFTSVTTGNWNNPATWDQNAVPSTGAYVFIDEQDTVTIQSNAIAQSITVKPYGVLKVVSDSTYVETAITNNGVFSMQGGRLTLGPEGVCNRMFTNPAGDFYITGGRLKVNGAFTAYGMGFTQTGGDLIVDANGTGSITTTSPVWIQTTNVNATAGNLVIVDPSVTGGSTFIGGGFSPGHNLIFGDSVSAATVSTGFIVQTNNRLLGNVIVRGTPGVSSGRDVKLYGNTRITGDLTLKNSNARFLMTQYYLYLKGNLTLDSNTTFIADYYLSFSQPDGTTNNVPQTVSGKGRFINTGSGTPSADFYALIFNNSAGVSFNIGNFAVSDRLTLTSGKIDLNGYTITQNNFATLQYSYNVQYPGCWFHGKYRAYLAPGQTNTPVRFPVGNAQAAKLLTLGMQDWNTVTRGGYITVSNIAGDHGNIGSSSINPGKTVNQQYVLDTTNSAGLIMGTGSFNVTANYAPADLDPNLVTPNFIAGKYTAAGWTYYPPSSASPYMSSVNVPATQLAGIYQFGESDMAPYITQQPQNVQACAGNDAQLQVVAQNANGYKWQVKTGTIWSDLQNGVLYSGVATNILRILQAPLTLNGGVYRCIAYNFRDSVISNEAMLTVGGTVLPAVTISVSPGTTVCAGQPATFTATAVNGGTIPTFQWKVNGIPSGSNQNTFTTTALTNNALVTCELISNLACANPLNATSNPLIMTVLPATPVSVTVTSSVPGNTICAGTPITFTAGITNGGSNPVYQWKKNGGNVGTNSNTYTDNTLANSDVIICTVTGSDCTAASTATSNSVTITVNPVVTPQVTISANNNPVCTGTNVTFTATPVNGGTSPAYQWKVNGGNTGGNSNVFTTATLNNNDVVSCVMTSNAGCLSAATATSNTITMSVTTQITPDVTISASNTSICAGAAATFTATPTNGGAAPGYQWKVNGINTGGNSNVFTTALLNNNDVVSCVMTSNGSCLSQATDTSNSITMTVLPVLSPDITIVASTNTICTGNAVQFTATASNGGTAPVYQWRINNTNVGTNSAAYSTTALNNGDVVSCVLTSNAAGCMTSLQDTSNTVVITVNPVVTPSVSVVSSAGNSFCQGANVIFTATPSNGGNAPAYQWKVNNIIAGTNAATFNTATLSNNDVITCKLVSNASCRSADSATSNGITVTVTPVVVPSVTITATPGTTVPAGTNVTFAASVVNGGSAPVYQWKVNGTNTGTNSPAFTSNSLNDGDVVTVSVTSTASCPSPQVVTSNSLTMHIQSAVGEYGENGHNIHVYPNPAKDNVTITAVFKSITPGSSVTITLQNMIGQLLVADQLAVTHPEFSGRLSLPAWIPAGNYLIRVNYNGQQSVCKIVIER